MKPPLFIECSVCGREFGSKSIVIHEPQCLQKLRRTEILQKERETAPTTTTGNYHNGKKARRRKKVVLERRKEEVEATTTTMTTMSDKGGPANFVLLATSSSSIVTTTTEKLPKIQPNNSSSFKIRRPCTAVLDKPRILNPEYIQYDMSLTRIDFTGQTKSTATVGMDENQNSRLQRQNTQVLDNNQRTGFILPTVDGTSIFPKYPNGEVQRSTDNHVSNNSKLVPCCANIMTTVDSILGDPQKNIPKTHPPRGETFLVRESGPLTDHVNNIHTNHADKKYICPECKFGFGHKTDFIRHVRIHSQERPFVCEECGDSFKRKDAEFSDLKSSSPPIESLFAAPNYLTKLSQCDLEKPLPNCFHLEKLPGHRPPVESPQDNFVTPTTSATNTEWLAQSLPSSQQPPGRHVPSSDCPACPPIFPPTSRKDDHPQSIPHPPQPEHDQLLHVQPHQQQQQQQNNESSEEALIQFDSPCQIVGVETTTTEKRNYSQEVFILKSETTPDSAANLEDSQDDDDECHLDPLPCHESCSKLSGRPNHYWIGQPFMKPPNYYSLKKSMNKCGTSKIVTLPPFNSPHIEIDCYTLDESSMYPPHLSPQQILQMTRMENVKHETFTTPNLHNIESKGKDEDDILHHSDGESRTPPRPFLTHPPINRGQNFIDDTVTVWEGSHLSDRETSSRESLPLIDFDNQVPLPPRPPTRRHSRDLSRPDHDETRHPPGQCQEQPPDILVITGTPEKKKPISQYKTYDQKIQSLISNVCRLHELQKEKQSQESDTQQRPKTSPANCGQSILGKTHTISRPGSANVHRPSTCIPISNKTGRIQGPPPPTDVKFTKNQTRKRSSLSRSAATKAIRLHSSSKRRLSVNRPATATATFRIKSGSKPRTTTTVSTAIVGPSLGLSGQNRKSGQFQKKKKLRADEDSSPSPASVYSTPYTTDDETLELIYSFKSKKPIGKKTKSSTGLLHSTPLQSQSHFDKAQLYTYIEMEKKKGFLQHQNSGGGGGGGRTSVWRSPRQDRNNNNKGQSTSSPCSSPTFPNSLKIQGRPATASKRLLQAKQVLRELSERRFYQDKESSPQITHKRSRRPKVRSRLPKPKSKPAEEERGGGQSLRRPELIPLSGKRVQFCSPVHQSQQQKQSSPKRKVFKKVPKGQTTTKNGKSKTDDGREKVKITIQADKDGQGMLRLSYKNDKNDKQIATIPMAPLTNKRINCEPPCYPRSDSLPPPPPSAESKEQDNLRKRELRESLERLENKRERHRGKDFERHRREKNMRNDHGPQSATSMISPHNKSFSQDKMLNVKIIVRRKNPDGSLPALENVIDTFTTKWTYLIVDEQPLTHGSPNPYLVTHSARPKPKQNPDNYYSLKITTSDQSTIDSLPSEEALHRFLTCYVCGKSFNAMEYPDHERECIHENKERNELLGPEEQRILPPKPQGTITIKHWNKFAYEALKDKYVKCPYCRMEYFPDRPEEVSYHDDRCTNRVMRIYPKVGVRDIPENYLPTSVQSADEASGWLAPASKLLSRGDWNRAAERAESYTRPAPRRYRQVKRHKK